MGGESAYVGGSFVEGFGDDLVQVAVVVLLLLTPLVFWFIYWW